MDSKIYIDPIIAVLIGFIYFIWTLFEIVVRVKRYGNAHFLYLKAYFKCLLKKPLCSCDPNDEKWVNRASLTPDRFGCTNNYCPGLTMSKIAHYKKNATKSIDIAIHDLTDINLIKCVASIRTRNSSVAVRFLLFDTIYFNDISTIESLKEAGREMIIVRTL